MGAFGFGGPRIITSEYLPARTPDHKEDARRMVRHGYAHVLRWLGEPVGPAPGEVTYPVFVFGGQVLTHPNTVRVIAGEWL